MLCRKCSYAFPQQNGVLVCVNQKSDYYHDMVDEDFSCCRFGTMMPGDCLCVSCGDIIPEGRLVCPGCMGEQPGCMGEQ